MSKSGECIILFTLPRCLDDNGRTKQCLLLVSGLEPGLHWGHSLDGSGLHFLSCVEPCLPGARVSVEIPKPYLSGSGSSILAEHATPHRLSGPSAESAKPLRMGLSEGGPRIYCWVGGV